jgi:hypothetical protein
MKSKGFDSMIDSEGKGFFGCMLAIVVLAAIIFVVIKVGPLYYTNYQFEDDLKNVISQAGARYTPNDAIIRDVLDLAKKYGINIKQDDADDNITIQRPAGQVYLIVRYFEPVDFLIFKKTLKFEIKLSSFSAG